MRLIDGDALIAWIKESQHMTSKMRNIICKVETMPSADRPTEVIYGNEHNCIMTIFGECSYAETGCGDCTVVEKVRKALSADRPQEWIPCSKRLPEYRKTVLISTFLGVKTGFLDSTEAYGDFWEIIEDDATVALHSVYAWMPLPKPWKGADD